MPGPFPNTEAELAEAVLQAILVTPQKVAVAKGIILEHAAAHHEIQVFVEKILSAMQITVPQQIHCHSEYDSTAQIQALADAISWQLACGEAMISLVNAGYLVLTSKEYRHLCFRCVCSMGWHKSPSYRGSVTFDELAMFVPSHVRLASSAAGQKNQLLMHPDLYLQTLNIRIMHPEITSAFKEAVQCFRHEFYGASVALLGKASEGAWIELGASLINSVPFAERSPFEKQQKILNDPRDGAARKMDAVLKVFENQAVFDSLARDSGVSLNSLRAVWVWSDVVRNSRNTIHFGASPAVPVGYEMVAYLLLAAISNVQVLYKLKESADKSRGSDPPA
jgi:hypothetical protein